MDNAYQYYYQQVMDPLQIGADSAMYLGLAWVASIVPALLIPIAIVAGILIATGQLSMQRAVAFAFPVLLMLFLIREGGYVTFIRDALINDIPAEIASRLHGGVNVNITAAQQFDVVDKASAHLTMKMLESATGITNIGTRGAIHIARFCQQVFLGLMFAVWLCVRALLIIGGAVTVFLLLFIPFASTRHLFMGSLNKIVGLVIWQVAATVLLKVQFVGLEAFLRMVLANSATLSIDLQLEQSFTIAVWFVISFILMLMLPTIAASQSAGAAQMAVIGSARMATGAVGAMSRAATAMTRASQAAGGRAGFVMPAVRGKVK